MSQDRGMEYLNRHYTASFGYLLEEDAVEAYELSQEKGIDEFEADLMLDVLHRQGYIKHLDDDGGALYSLEHFDIDTHQEIMEEFNL